MNIINSNTANIMLNDDFPNIDKCIKYINKNHITDISLYCEYNSDTFEIDFLQEIKNFASIKKLGISCNPTDLDVIYNFSEIETLALSPPKGTLIDLSRFPKLKELITGNASSFKNLESAKLEYLNVYQGILDFEIVCQILSLKELDLEGIKNFSFNKIKTLLNLKRITIDQMNVKNLDGIEHLKNLNDLYIQYARSLEKLDGISELNKLSSVSLINCPKLTDINELAGCTMLKKLHLESIKNCDLIKLQTSQTLEFLKLINCGSISSLKFIETLKYLEFFVFIDTNIIDGDLTPCLRLKYAGTLDKNHYNLKMAELPKEQTKYSPVISAKPDIVEEIKFG